MVRSILDLAINDIVWSLNDYHRQGDKLRMESPWYRFVAVQDSFVFLSRVFTTVCPVHLESHLKAWCCFFLGTDGADGGFKSWAVP